MNRLQTYKEAISWVYNLGPIIGDLVIVLGEYDAKKVEVLKGLDEKLNVIWVQISQEPIENVYTFANANDFFESDLLHVVLDKKPMILTDRRSWAASTSIYAQLFAHLTGRSMESLTYHLNEIGIDMKALPKKEGLIAITDVLKESRRVGSQIPAMQIMGEIVK